MIGIPIGLLAVNASEWLVHKYVLHGLGRNKKSHWSYHWHQHHKNSRKHGHYDPDYDKGVFHDNGIGREAVSLVLTGLAVLPLFPVAPFFTSTLLYCTANYYRKHKRAHQDTAWARQHLPWHYDHHMGPNQDANWCVTRPWFDHIMGTRKPYVGTEQELAVRERDCERAAHAATLATTPGLEVIPAAAA